MPIYSDDLFTMKAAVPGQYVDSGGRISAEEVENNEVGNLLPKLTEIARAGGRVDLAKWYLAIRTPDRSEGADAYTFLDQSPSDPLVDCLLFRPQTMGTRAAHTDLRAAAQAYVEAYQIKSGVAPWYLKGVHTAGMSTLTLWCSVTARLPEIGATLYLVANEGAGETSQYVQILYFTHAIETFEYSLSDRIVEYQRRLIYVDLTSALQASYVGPEVNQVLPASPAVKIRESVVADGSRYYGRSELITAAEVGDTVIRVDSVYGYAAPAARSEIALAGVDAITVGMQTVTSGGETFTLTGPSHVLSDAVTAINRRTIWTKSLIPIAGSGGLVRAQVRILERWYTVTEGERGGVGALTYDRRNGSAILSLTALPDAGSRILWEWASQVHFVDRAGQAASLGAAVMQGDFGEPVDRSSVTWSWISGGAQKSAITSAGGVVSGDIAGFVTPGGRWWLGLSANRPDAGTTITVDYDPTPRHGEVFPSELISADSLSVVLAQSPVPGSVEITWAVKQGTTVSGYVVHEYVGMRCVEEGV